MVTLNETTFNKMVAKLNEMVQSVQVLEMRLAALEGEAPRVLADDWKPGGGAITLAHQLGLDLNEEAEKFRNYADMKGRKLKDWDAGFRNWLHKADEYKHGKTSAKKISDAMAEFLDQEFE